MTTRRERRTVVAVAAASSLVAALLVGTAALGGLAVGVADVTATVFGLGALTFILLLLAVVRGAKDRAASTPPAPLVPDGDDDGTLRSPGAAFARRLDGATTGERIGRDARQRYRDRVRSELRDLAVETLCDADDRERDAAREAVATGTWTDDALAAAFLANDDGPTVPLGAWVRTLLHPEGGFYARVERTVREIAAIRGADAGPEGGAAR